MAVEYKSHPYIQGPNSKCLTCGSGFGHPFHRDDGNMPPKKAQSIAHMVDGWGILQHHPYEKLGNFHGQDLSLCKCGRLPEDPIHQQEEVEYERFLIGITTTLHHDRIEKPNNIRLELTTKEHNQIVFWVTKDDVSGLERECHRVLEQLDKIT